jgi:acyl carrier protein
MPTNATKERVRDILRRNLMLGPDVEIPDDKSLFQGDFDLDSLDALLLLNCIEKEFGIKVGREAVTPDVLKTVSDVSAFVEACQAEHSK